MCLAIPGRVVEIYREDEILMGRIDYGGISKGACLEHVPEVKVGNYVIVHVGFALSIIEETEAHRVFDYLEQMNEVSELTNDEGEGVEVR